MFTSVQQLALCRRAGAQFPDGVGAVPLGAGVTVVAVPLVAAGAGALVLLAGTAAGAGALVLAVGLAAGAGALLLVVARVLALLDEWVVCFFTLVFWGTPSTPLTPPTTPPATPPTAPPTAAPTGPAALLPTAAPS
ncbi:MAG: hypothetical protein B7Y95_12065 [Rhizobiales bacterium 32-66-11]|nr:MAG: hypothetical protein B7Y95_12065 [Rhizobiales bacterium 32-66-11]